MNPQWLKAKTFGMPRWAFLALLAGGIVLGLYLRNRRQAAQAQQPTVGSSDTLDGTSDPGLAGVGVTSPPGGVYPVSSPVIPEGFSDITGQLTDLAGGLATTIGELPSAVNQVPQSPTVNITLPGSGGGPPKRPASHTTPKSGTNTNKQSPRYGKTYKVVQAKGGVYHVYPGGRKVFVKK